MNQTNQQTTDGEEQYELTETDEEAYRNRGIVTVFEQTKDTQNNGVGDRYVALGYQDERRVRDPDAEGFPVVAVAVAHIDLHEPIPEDEFTAWCNSDVGKLALSNFFPDQNVTEKVDVLTELGEERVATEGDQA